jgi:hypothetical protein
LVTNFDQLKLASFPITFPKGTVLPNLDQRLRSRTCCSHFAEKPANGDLPRRHIALSWDMAFG